jgi:superfamily II DNA/RNA helicase
MTFSATFPEGIKKFLSKYLGTDYEFIKVSNKLTVDNIDH